MTCPMAPLALGCGAIFALSYLLPLIPCWAYVVAGAGLVALWATMVDADLPTYLACLRGVDASKLRGKVVWIVGASSGIGEEIAVQCSALGARVVLSARREKELERVADRCRSQGGNAVHPPMVLPLDILDSSAHSGAVESILVANDGRLDFVFLNSGRTQRSLAEQTDLDVTRQMLELNVVSLVGIVRAVLPTFLSQRSGGTFVVTSSVAGKVGAPVSSSYCASKFALQGYMDALRLEVADRGVSVLLACPGPVNTPIEAAAFTGRVGVAKGSTTESREAKMPAERCAKLMLAALTHGIDETWISRNPVLFFTYLSQYAPNVARYIGKRWFGPMRTRAFRDGVDIYNFKQMTSGIAGSSSASKQE